MKNMGLGKLSLVRPRQFPSKEATLFAASASDLLAKAQVFDGLDEALKGCANIIATSSRSRRLPIQTYPVREGTKELIQIVSKAEEEIAILFGSEDRGLTNDELLRCRMHFFIPTDMEYPVLNLASAVQIVCYELLCGAQDFDKTKMIEPLQDGKINTSNRLARHKEMPLADDAAMESFYQHLEEWLHQIKFFNPQRPASIMRKMRRIFNRVPLYANEADMLRGVITHSVRHCKNNDEE